jgi:hypothetical protein
MSRSRRSRDRARYNESSAIDLGGRWRTTHVDRRDGDSQGECDQEESPFDTPDYGDPREDVGEDAERGGYDGHDEAPVGQKPIET